VALALGALGSAASDVPNSAQVSHRANVVCKISFLALVFAQHSAVRL